MKFNSGYWLLREGVTARYATQALDVQTSPSGCSIAVLTKRVEHRGSHLNTPTITVELSAPAPDVISVRTCHHSGAGGRSVAFELTPGPVAVRIEQDDASLRLVSARLTAEAALSAEWGLTFRGDGSLLTGSSGRSLASMTDATAGHFMTERLDLPVGANVYGFGERFTPFVKNGQVIETWNEDGGTASEQAYKAVPFFLTDAGFGVFINSPARVSFEVASEVVSAVQFCVRGQELEYLVIYGPTPAEILGKYTMLTGRPALPPRWSFGLWLSTSFLTDYDEATVTHFVDGMAQRRIPLSVLHFDCYWMRPLQWCDFEWNPDAFPEPGKMLQRLGARGLRLSVWINPYLGQRSPLFREAAQAGYLVRRPDGSVWQWDMWVPGMGLIDFTNPAARQWYAGKVRALLESGVDAVKTDFGERIPEDVVWYDGSDPHRMHNYYTYLYNRTVFEAVERHRGEGEAVLFARSATVGCQKFPVHWGGDCQSTYASMAESLRGGLSLGLCGFGFWSHDIGGFEGTPSAALFKRWVAFGLLSSHSRLHGSESYRVPWTFDDEAVAITRDFAVLKNSLMPYLWAAAVEAHKDGIPVMRAMMLEFPSDRTCSFLDRQYMLGPDLLVAPVFSDEGDVDVYIPAGTWLSYLDGGQVTGPGWVRQRHGFDSLPLLVRPGSVIAVGSRTDRPDYDDAISPAFEVFGMVEGDQRTVRLFDASGAERVRVQVSRSGEHVTATVAAGQEHLAEGWMLRWVTGPRGEERGPSVHGTVSDREVALQVP